MVKDIKDQAISELDEVLIELGAQLHTLRIATGLKIEELGSIAKIEPSIIDGLEIGRGELDFNALVGLAKFYDKKLHISLD